MRPNLENMRKKQLYLHLHVYYKRKNKNTENEKNAFIASMTDIQ